MRRYGWTLFLAISALAVAARRGHRTIRRQNWPRSWRTDCFADQRTAAVTTMTSTAGRTTAPR